jgi:predicted DNA-binding transcriptional regulator AlpA
MLHIESFIVSGPTAKRTAAQVPLAKKAAALKAASCKTGGAPPAILDQNQNLARAALAADAEAERNGVEARAHATRGPPVKVDLGSVQERLAARCGLLDKREIVAITGVSFPTIWDWMRQGKFPRAHIVVGKSKWHAADIAGWLSGLPPRPLKGDAPLNQKIEEHAA